MKINAELQRNLWLEFTPARLIGMPLTLGLIFYVSTNIGHPDSEHITLSALAMLIYGLLVGLWGGRKAADAVIDEVNEGTWDFQRLSSLSALNLALGKLFGSPSYTWYGGLMALIVYIGACINYLFHYYLLCNIVLLLEAGLICHATALFSSLQSVQGINMGREKIKGASHHFIGLMIGFFFFSSLAYSPFGHKSYNGRSLPGMTISWYGTVYDSSGFTACFGFVLFLWLLAGIHAQMRAHLQVRSGPWLWSGFVLFMMFFTAGFFSSLSLPNGQYIGILPLIAAFSVSLFFFYGTAFTESWNGMSYRRLQDAWRKKNYSRVLALSPRWMVSLWITLLTTLVFTIVHFGTPFIWVEALALLCFAVRDVAMMHFFRLAPQNRRAMAAIAFWLAVLYILLPMLFKALGLSPLLPLLLPFSTPPITDPPYLSFVSGALQALCVILLTLRRWTRYWKIR